MKKSYPTYKSQTFTGKIVRKENENFLIYNYPKIVRQYLNLSCRPGDNVTITLTNKAPKRTLQQNNYYWLYLGLIALSSGHDTKMLHDRFRGEFLSKGITEVFGAKTRKVKSTTDLNRPEFCEYLERIEVLTEIPLPDCEPFLKPLTYAEYDKLSEAQRSSYEKMKAKIFMVIGKIKHGIK